MKKLWDDENDDDGDNDDFWGSLNSKPNMRIRQEMKTTTQAEQASKQQQSSAGTSPHRGPLTQEREEEEERQRFARTLREEESRDAEQGMGHAPR